eukprot:TRINITY_DN1156_c0_g1_i1.p1 TRINITY_DN1156_c0_g1~~TRINITY_DN1156_c0_g1_i1.p1  ORF type:complete len:1044 (+),score=272.67 TRINITY_DN1156_c0_g1_i1:98-3229(+)
MAMANSPPTSPIATRHHRAIPLAIPSSNFTHPHIPRLQFPDADTTTVGYTVPTLAELCQLSVAQHMDLHSEAIRSLPIDLMDKLISFMLDMLHPRFLTQTQTRPLKIRLVRHNRTVTFRCLSHGTVAQAIQQIYERSETEDSIPGASGSAGVYDVNSFGLFQPAGSFHKARWLKEDEALSFYDIDPSDQLDFKLKSTVLKLSFLGPWEKVVHPLHLATLDTTMKTFVVDESKTVAQIAQDIARKLGIKHREEFSLKLQQGPDDVGTWLVPDLTLPEQGVDPLCNILLLKRQFYFDREPISMTADPDTLHFVFCQCLDAVVTATHPCSRDEAVLFAALQCQACFGDLHQGFLTPHGSEARIRLKEFFPPEYTVSKHIWKNVLQSWSGLAGASEEKCKIGYIQLTKSLKSYGFTFFNVQRFVRSASASGKMSQTRALLLGISHDMVLIIDPDTKETVNRYFFTQIRKWQVLYSFFSLFFATHKEEYLTVEAEAISQVLSTYIHHSLRNSPSVQKQFTHDFATVGRIYRGLSAGRRRSSTDSDSGQIDFSDFAANVRKCPLYVEPKKIFVNPIFGGPASFPMRYEDIIKVNKFTRMIQVLTRLSQKMVRKMSRAPSPIMSPTSVESGTEREIQFSDRKIITFLVDDRKTVTQITREVGLRMGIKNIEEFSLQVPQMPFPDDDPSVPVPSPGLWLNPYLSLAEQNIPSSCPLLFKKKFFYNEAADDCHTDPVYFHLLFCQSRDAIIENTFSCTKEEAIKLASTLFQINFGDHNPTIHKPGFLKAADLKFFLPPSLIEQWGMSFQQVERAIYQEHRNLRGIKEVYAKFRYVQLCRSLKTYGATFFPVRQQQIQQGTSPPLVLPHPSSSSPPSSSLSFLSLHHHLIHNPARHYASRSSFIGITGAGGSGSSTSVGSMSSSSGGRDRDRDRDREKDKEPSKDRSLFHSKNLLLGFSRMRILVLTAKDKRFLLDTPLSHLRRWAYNPQNQIFTLDFGDYEEGVFSFFTPQGESISQYLSDYIDFIQAKIVATQTFSESDLQLAASHNNLWN